MNTEQVRALTAALAEAGVLQEGEDAAMLLLKVRKRPEKTLEQSLTAARSPSSSPQVLQLVHALAYALDVLLDSPPPDWPAELRAPFLRDGTTRQPDVPTIVPDQPFPDPTGDNDAQ